MAVGCQIFGSDDNNNGNTVAPGQFDPSGLYEDPPDVSQCVAGTLSPEYQERLLARLNQIRAQHELPPVTLAEHELPAVQAAAMHAVANGTISHQVNPASHCYTDEVARAADESLLFLSAGNEVGNVQDPDRFLVEWLRDPGVGNLGHRRWLIDPFLTEVAFGFAHGDPIDGFPYTPVVGATLDVLDGAEAPIADTISYVAYPFGLYPAELFDLDGVLSFSVVAVPTSRFDNDELVAFDAAVITVTDANDTSLSVTDVSSMTDITGLPNVLMWRVDGLALDGKYTVRIEGVLVDEVVTDYVYDFALY